MAITHSYTEPFVATPNSVIESSAVNSVHESIRHLKDYLPEVDAAAVGKFLKVTAEDDVGWEALPESVSPFVPGEIKMYGGSAAPSAWLLCEGQAVSRSTYADLFAVITTTFGSGDGSTTFNLPDFRDRAPAGAGTSYVVGQQFGAVSVDMDHFHGMNGHTHSYTTGGPNTTQGVTTGGGNEAARNDHSHGGTSDPPNTPNTQGSSKGNIDVRQPSLGIRFMIYTGVAS